VSLTAPTGLIVTEGYRSIRLMIIGTAATDDLDIGIYGVERSYSAGRGNSVPMYLSQLFMSTNDVLAGSTTGVAGGLVTENEVFFDTYPALAVTAYGTAMLNYVSGSVGAFSPGSNGIGHYYISDLGNLHGIVPQLDGTPDSIADYVRFLFILDK